MTPHLTHALTNAFFYFAKFTLLLISVLLFLFILNLFISFWVNSKFHLKIKNVAKVAESNPKDKTNNSKKEFKSTTVNAFELYGSSHEYPAILKSRRLKFTLADDFLPSHSSSNKKPSKYPLNSFRETTKIPLPDLHDNGERKISGDAELDAVFSSLINLALKDFVHTWFSHISTDLTFEKNLFDQFACTLERLAQRSSAIDIEKLISEKIINGISTHLYQYRKTERIAKAIIQKRTSALSKGASTTFPISDVLFDKNKILAEVDQLTLVTNSLFVRGKLHPAVCLAAGSNGIIPKFNDQELLSQDNSTAPSSENPKYFDLNEQDKKNIAQHLRMRLERILPYLQDPKLKNSSLRNVLLREIFSNSVFGSIILTLSDPDTTNSILESQLENIIKEKKLVEELNDVLNYSTGSPDPENKNQDALDASKKATTVIENLLATIESTNSSETLENIQSEILEEIRKKRILISGQDRENIVHGELVGDVMSYINQLYFTKKLVGNKINRLPKFSHVNNRSDTLAQVVNQSITQPNKPVSHSITSNFIFSKITPPLRKKRKSLDYYPQGRVASKVLPHFTLEELLSNVSGLSAFAEYMGSIGMKFNLEFWTNINVVLFSMSDPDVLPAVVNSLWKTYFTRRVDELYASSELISDVQKFLKKFKVQSSIELSGLTNTDCIEVIRLMALVQRDVYSNMDQIHYPKFLETPLYSRFLHIFALSPSSGIIFNPAVDQRENINTYRENIDSSGYVYKLKQTQISAIGHSKPLSAKKAKTESPDPVSESSNVSSRAKVTFEINGSNEAENQTISLAHDGLLIQKKPGTQVTVHDTSSFTPGLTKSIIEPYIEIVNNITGVFFPSKNKSAISTLKKISQSSNLNQNPSGIMLNPSADSDTANNNSSLFTALPADKSSTSLPSQTSKSENKSIKGVVASTTLPESRRLISELGHASTQVNERLDSQSPSIDPGSFSNMLSSTSSAFTAELNHDYIEEQIFSCSLTESNNDSSKLDLILSRHSTMPFLQGNLFLYQNTQKLYSRVSVLQKKINFLDHLVNVAKEMEINITRSFLVLIQKASARELQILSIVRRVVKHYYKRNMIVPGTTKVNVSVIFENSNSNSISSNASTGNNKGLLHSDTSPRKVAKTTRSRTSSFLRAVNLRRPRSNSSSSSEPLHFFKKKLAVKFNLNVLKLQKSTQEFQLQWIVSKTYKQFLDLHKKLLLEFPTIMNKHKLLPIKRSIFLATREKNEYYKHILENYISALIVDSRLVGSDTFKEFLSNIGKDESSSVFSKVVFDEKTDLINHWIAQSPERAKANREIEYVFTSVRNLGVDNPAPVLEQMESHLEATVVESRGNINVLKTLKSLYEMIPIVRSSTDPGKDVSPIFSESQLKKYLGAEDYKMKHLDENTTYNISSGDESHVCLPRNDTWCTPDFNHAKELDLQENIDAVVYKLHSNESKKKVGKSRVEKVVKAKKTSKLGFQSPLSSSSQTQGHIKQESSTGKSIFYGKKKTTNTKAKNDTDISSGKITKTRESNPKRKLYPYSFKGQSVNANNQSLNVLTMQPPTKRQSDHTNDAMNGQIPHTMQLGAKVGGKSKLKLYYSSNSDDFDSANGGGYSSWDVKSDSGSELGEAVKLLGVECGHNHNHNHNHAHKHKRSFKVLDGAKNSSFGEGNDSIFNNYYALHSEHTKCLSGEYPATKQKAPISNLGTALSELFIEVFNLNNRSNWFRRQAFSIILKHVLGSTLEKKSKEMLFFALNAKQMAKYLGSVQDLLWPLSNNRVFSAPKKIRLSYEREQTYKNAKQSLLYYVPLLLGNFVGKKNAYIGTNRIFNLVQVQRLNAHLVLSLFDAILDELFPEAALGNLEVFANTGVPENIYF